MCLFSRRVLLNFAATTMENKNEFTDALLMAALKLDSHDAFVEIFRMYYSDLVMFCGQFVDSREACEDIVQDVFVKLWEDRRRLEIRRSLKSYLTVLVQNRALDELRHSKVKAQYASGHHLHLLSLSPGEHLFYSDLNAAFDDALSKLPEPVRDTLLLSLHDKLSYPQIATRLGVSVRTVEARMSKALKYIRGSLSDFKAPVMAAAVLLNNV